MQTNIVTSQYASLLSVITLLLCSSSALAQAPKVTMQTLAHTVCEGGTVRLEVTATGQLPLTYEWYRGMFIYTNMTLNQTTSTLVLSNVTPAMAGYFRVRVVNGAGNDWSRFAYVAVLDAGMETNGFGITIRATTNTTWRVECTTNLVGGANWFTLTNLVVPFFPPYYIRYVDLEGTNGSRLYRVVPTIY